MDKLNVRMQKVLRFEHTRLQELSGAVERIIDFAVRREAQADMLMDREGAKEARELMDRALDYQVGLLYRDDSREALVLLFHAIADMLHELEG